MAKKNRAFALWFLSVPLVVHAASGTLVYSTYVPGTDRVNAIALDNAGNIIAAGVSGNNGAFASVPPGGFNGSINSSSGSVVLTALVQDSAGTPIVAGYNPTSGFVQRTGSTPWSVNVPGTPLALAIDSQNNIYITGAADAGLKTTTGVVQPTNKGGSDAFVIKLSPTGAVVYATYFGGSNDDFAYAIAVDSKGQAYIAGSTASPDFPLRNAAQATFGGLIQTFSDQFGDAFVAKLDPNGANLVYSTYWGGKQADLASGIAVDASGSAYIAGSTQSTDFPVSGGAYQTTYAGDSAFGDVDPNGDAFLAKFDPNGAPVWSTFFGGTSDDWAVAVALDSTGNVYIAGTSESFDLPQTANALPTCRTLGRPFVAEFDPTGAKLLAATGLPGLGYDNATALAVNSTGVYIAGYAASQAFFAYSAANATYAGNNTEGFVAKLNLAASPGVFPACVLSAASFLAGNEASFFNGAVAPGEIVSAFGVGLGPTPAANLQLTASGSVATALGGTQVLFDGIPAPLLYASANQVNAIVPYGIKTTTTNMIVSSSAGASANDLLPVVPAVPAIFTASQTGQQQALVLNQDYSVNSPSNAAPRGSYIMIFAEGAGLMTPTMADGSVAPGVLPLPAPALKVSATIRGADAPIQYAGAAPGFVSGVLQVNVQVPTAINPDLTAPLAISVGGQASQFNVTVAVK